LCNPILFNQNIFTPKKKKNRNTETKKREIAFPHQMLTASRG